MLKRFLMVFITYLIAVGILLMAARHPTGPNTVSFDEPIGLWLSFGLISFLFLPPLLCSLFNNRVVRIVSAVYQAVIVLSFLGMTPIGLLFSKYVGLSMLAIIGTIVSICSVIITLKTNTNKEKEVHV